MVTAYFDCFSGISGNMVLGAFIEAGLDSKELGEVLGTLPIDGYEIEIKDVIKHGIKAKHLDVKTLEKQPHRHLHHIEGIISQGNLPQEVKELALKIFKRLATAEAKVHGTTIEKVHFHEVGAVDAIVDIVGAAYGIYKLGIKKVYASPLNVGKGMVKCAHGLMPIPAPATAELLQKAVSYNNDVEGELVTPTGAAIITTLTEKFGNQPPLKIKKIAYGAGTWDLKIPNVLRLLLGEELNQSNESDEVMVIETNIDDMNPEIYDYLMDRLFSLGALDVYLSPIYMKKNRPGTLLSVICDIEKHKEIINTIFKETTTLGIRLHKLNRVKLVREQKVIETSWGKIKVKVSKYDNKVINIKPEFKDCKKIAEETGIPLKKVLEEARLSFLKQIEL